MQNYIDLRQLPANQIKELIQQLCIGDITGLSAFYNSLGILYGYPIEDYFDVYSDNVLLDKNSLNQAFASLSSENEDV